MSGQSKMPFSGHGCSVVQLYDISIGMAEPASVFCSREPDLAHSAARLFIAQEMCQSEPIVHDLQVVERTSLEMPAIREHLFFGLLHSQFRCFLQPSSSNGTA
jgi:hypothetical protein